jgi:hypothetical protein
MNPLFEPNEAENLDADCEDAPQRFRAMSGLIEPTVQTDWVEQELANSNGDRVFTVSVEEPISVGQVVREAPWRRAMEEELQEIEENRTWTLTELPHGQRAIGLKWVFKVKRDEGGGQSCNTRRGSSSRGMLNGRELITMRCSPQSLGWKLSSYCSRWPPRRGGRSIIWT